ncbi:hypothetical protein BJ875DRAFT_352519, partial [Amylocarpus encephaloides]
KRRKLKHPRGSQLPTAFLDNLSKILLTKCALKEIDRRKTQPSLSSPNSLNRIGRTLTGSENIIKLHARHGGPDLSNLRG